MRIYFADDHPLFLEAVKLQLERTRPDCEVILAETLEAVLDHAQQIGKINLIVLDHSMPGMNGAEGIERVREAYGDVPVAVMSGIAGSTDVHAALQAGAKGFLPKTLPGPAFASALTVIAEGGTYLPAEFLAGPPDLLSMGDAAREQSTNGYVLTPREAEVLQGLVDGNSNKEIARNLEIQEVTVKLHARRIFQKLGVRNRAQAAAFAVERRLVPAPTQRSKSAEEAA